MIVRIAFGVFIGNLVFFLLALFAVHVAFSSASAKYNAQQAAEELRILRKEGL